MKQAILIIGNFLSETLGTRGVCEDLAVKLERSGWAVISASRRLGRVERLLDMIGTAWNRRRSYAVAQVDVYSGLAFLWAEAVCWTLRRAGKPYVLTLHGGNLPAFAERRPLRMRRLLCSAAAVTTPSRYLFEHMRPYRTDLSLIPNALDLSKYEFKQRTPPQPRLVWLRAFHETYNPVLAIQVVSLLAKDISNIQLIMIGPDKGDGSMQRTRQEAERLGIADHVVIQSAVLKSEVPFWLNKGDIFLNTTNVDNMPVSVLEAMASGLCVVSTNVGGLSYLLRDEHDALLVRKNNPEEMTAAVRRLLTEPTLAGYLSHNAHEKVKILDWTMILPQWNKLLTSVIATNTKVI